MGGEIEYDCRLEDFDINGSTIHLNTSKGKVDADQIILAMPRRALDLITPNSPPLQEDTVKALVGSVSPRPLFKLFTTYDSPWWRNAGYTDESGAYVPVESGRTLTDLPVRQTYYWPTTEGEHSTGGPSMLMASYDDGDNIGFWDGLRPRRGKAWQAGHEVAKPADPFDGQSRQEEDPRWKKYRASRPMVAEVARQLSIIHGLSYTPDVINASFRDWGDDPYGGWNSWNIGVKSWDVKKQITQPINHVHLYICGEAYSDAQGWVEDALQTADYVLDKFGMKPL